MIIIEKKITNNDDKYKIDDKKMERKTFTKRKTIIDHRVIVPITINYDEKTKTKTVEEINRVKVREFYSFN